METRSVTRFDSKVAALDGDYSWRHGEGFSHGQALLAVDEQAVVLDAEVLLQGGFSAQECLESVLSLAQLVLQVIHGAGDLANLLDQSVQRKKMTQRFQATSVKSKKTVHTIV